MQKKHLATIGLALVAISGNARAQDCGASDPETVVAADILVDTTWSGEIILQQPIFVKSGATLTITPGTIVRGQPRTGPVIPGIIAGSPGALIVTQSGRIRAEGSSSAPIIMTTAAVDNNGPLGVGPADNIADDDNGDGFEDAWVPGDLFLDDECETKPLSPLNPGGTANVALWGGLVVLGSAPINVGNCAGLGVGRNIVEGLTVPGFPVADATYGGTDAHDNSGSLRYLSVRHAGDEIGNSNELNGVTVAGVGDATEFEFIEVYANFDDGIEWFGGTVNGRNLMVSFAGDDTFDLDQGYTGSNQFLFGLMNYFRENGGTNFGTSSGDKAGEWDGDDFNEVCSNANLVGPPSGGSPSPWPLSSANVWNLTVIGSTPDGPNPAVSPRGGATGVQMRNGYAGELYNSIVVNTGTGRGFDIPNPPGDGGAPGYLTCLNVTAGLASVLSSTFQNVGALGLPCEDTAIANGNTEALALGAPPVTSANCYPATALQFAGLVNENDAFLPTGASGKLQSSLLAAPINPRPINSPSPECRLGGPEPTFFGLDPAATYRGAFSSTAPAVPGIWTTGWTALSQAGLLSN
jgi:hypothetical protein